MARKLLTKVIIFLTISICSPEFKKQDIHSDPKTNVTDASKQSLKNTRDSDAVSTNLTNTIFNLLASETLNLIERVFKSSPFAPQGDPEVKLKVTEIIHSHGYTLQSHDVETDDGYIITVQRIPHGKNGKGTKPRQPVKLFKTMRSNIYTQHLQ